MTNKLLFLDYIPNAQISQIEIVDSCNYSLFT